jgi:tRNA (cmo5U34)-methyltransferase
MTAIPAAEAFSAHAPQYTALRRRLVPVYDRFYGAVVEVLDALLSPTRHDHPRVLDLGAGTGLLSVHLLSAFPGAEIELLDASEPMLAEARARLGDGVGAVHVADMTGSLPAGPFDAIVSALAIHHLEHADKRALMRRAHERLAPGGVFVNADQLSAPNGELTEIYERRWADECRALGASERELADARERMRHDRCIDLEPQLRWMREAGFDLVDCMYKHWRFGVMVGVRS